MKEDEQTLTLWPNKQKNPNNPLNKLAEGAKATFEQASKAMPGPAISQNIGGEEGTKEERRAKAEQLNK